ncbi:MAG: divergent polysaccharide deacetylase family protein, partial [Desulfuromonadaceae bacterium]
AGLEDLRVELESALLRSGVSLAQIQQRQQNGITVFDVANEFPPPEVLHRLTERLRGRLPAVAIDTEIRPSSLLVYLNGQVVYSLRFSPPAPEQPGPAALGGPVVTPVEKGKLAIIMDDLGQDMTTARRVLAIDLPVTFAIIPTNERAFEVATLAHEQGREVLIHIPMEPKGYPAINPGEDALLVRLSAAEIRRRLISFRRRVPYAVGGNNHMGSAFTEDRQQMSLVMQELRDAGMFFVDSRTSSRSLAVEIARATGVPTASRDVFLDNVQQVDSIARELHRLVRLALRHGQAVGICHPYPQTLKALQREADYIRSQGVQVVFASQLVTLR